ncbi:MAG TPA: hypothetical protein VEU30_17210 [Thermoanaerobaculia bacterium]|nr:hypothetical protein [Thermoanaerobaculia bacterium]
MTTMELDDFKGNWNDGGAIRVNPRAAHAHALVRTEDSLRRQWRGVVFELILDALALLAIGSFLGDHFSEPRYLIPAAVLHLAVILLAIPLGRQLVLLRGIDYTRPVVEIQRQVELVRIEEIRATKWTLLISPLLWVPLLIVALKGLLGIDVWAIFDLGWILANVLFGVAFIPLMLWASRTVKAGSPRMQRWMDSLAGRSLRAARLSLEQVAEFER